MKKATNFRLTPEALALILRIAEKLGVSQASVIEMAVRELARKQKVS